MLFFGSVIVFKTYFYIQKVIEMDQQTFVDELSKLRTSSMFLTVNGYRNEYGEVADYSIIFHMNYVNALKKSLAIVEEYTPVDDLEKEARKQLIHSYRMSLFKLETTPLEEFEDAYTHFRDEDGNYIKGVRLHTKTGVLHLFGLLNAKRIIIPGYYPDDKRRPLTKVKERISCLGPVSRYRQFRMHPSQVESISVQNISLLPPEQNK